MHHRKSRGTTLIEVLVVIVVFLVGILAIVQVFPPGINILRTTRNNTIAAQLGESETQRILGRSNQLAEMIVPVTYTTLSGGGLQVVLDTTRQTRDLMPPKDPGNLPGRIDINGNVLINGQPVGDWQRMSGSNLFSRVIGESSVVPAPRQIPGIAGGFGGVYTLTFGPAYYVATNQGIGQDGVVQAYGNDFVRIEGNRDFNQPNPFGRYRDSEFYFVAADSTDDLNFSGEDQLWIAPSGVRKYRISASFAYDNNGNVNQYDVIVQANLDPNNVPAYALRVGNYWVISLQKLISQPDIYGQSQFVESGYRFAEFGSLRVQRIYQEIPVGQAFNANDPYEYKVLGTGKDQFGSGFCVGTLLFNPTGYSVRVRSSQSASEALLARIDYAVFDWRLIKDEFRIPQSEVISGQLATRQTKLVLNSIKVLGNSGPDGRPFKGTGLDTPTITPLTGSTDDVVVFDADSGGVILGNVFGDPASAWIVDKSLGFITFRDVDNDSSNGLSAYICFPTGDPQNPWTNRQLVPDITNRAVRVMYQGNQEWSVQPFKAARSYRVTRYLGAQGMSPGESFVGGSPDINNNPIGQNHRLYFAPYDLGQKVIVGEMWLTQNGGQPFALYDQEFQVNGIENLNGQDFAFAEIYDKAPGGSFDISQGYAVRRVRGASLKVRVMWNPSQFKLGTDTAANYNELEAWMRNWRRTDNESLQTGGRN